MNVELTGLMEQAEQNDRVRSERILALNEQTRKYGLNLSPQEAAGLTVARWQALAASGRVEIGAGVLEKIIRVFSKSEYLYQEDYLEVLHEVQENFYLLRNDLEDRISDDSLIAFLFQNFEKYKGSLAFFQGRELEKLRRSLCFGHFGEEKEEKEEENDEE